MFFIRFVNAFNSASAKIKRKLSNDGKWFTEVLTECHKLSGPDTYYSFRFVTPDQIRSVSRSIEKRLIDRALCNWYFATWGIECIVHCLSWSHNYWWLPVETMVLVPPPGKRSSCRNKSVPPNPVSVLGNIFFLSERRVIRSCVEIESKTSDFGFSRLPSIFEMFFFLPFSSLATITMQFINP